MVARSGYSSSGSLLCLQVALNREELRARTHLRPNTQMTHPHPRRFEDDGSVVTLDVHGCSVDDALYMIRRSLQEAYRRGRKKVEIIHGVSTSVGDRDGRTIKNEVEKRLAAGEFADWTSGYVQDGSGGRTSLWIRLGSPSNRQRIAVSHIVPPRR